MDEVKALLAKHSDPDLPFSLPFKIETFLQSLETKDILTEISVF